MNALLLAPASPDGDAPVRRAGSIRRTSTLDTLWPEGYGAAVAVTGRARDLLTTAQDAVTAAEDWVRFTATPRREILSIETCRSNDAAQALVCCRGGGHLRAAIAEALPEERAGATALHLLLDDFSGASLVANWGWSQWLPDWRERMYAQGSNNAGKNGRMEGVCAGFRPGSTSLHRDGSLNPSLNAVAVPPLQRSGDPLAWHAIAPQPDVGMRRARRLDVWLDAGNVCIDASFQDSAARPDGGRAAVHEYRVRALADRETLRLREIEAVPGILPYSECLGAVPSGAALIGLEFDGLRSEVLARLQGTIGCTHLNDVFRSLADVPALLRRLEAAHAD